MPATVLQIGPFRVCSKCGETKDVESFSPAPRVKSGLQRECKSCVVLRASAWAKDHSERDALGRKNRFYKIDFNGMWEKQGGLCSICSNPMLPKGKTAKSVVVDHDRKCCPGRGSCGKCVRGLVHSRCNIVLGVIESEGSTVEAAQKYLLAQSKEAK